MVIKYLIETFFVQMVIFWKCVSIYLNIKIKLLRYFWAENLWEHVQNIVYSQVLSSQIQFVIKFNVNRFFFFKTQKVVEEILDTYNFFFYEMKSRPTDIV